MHQLSRRTLCSGFAAGALLPAATCGLVPALAASGEETLAVSLGPVALGAEAKLVLLSQAMGTEPLGDSLARIGPERRLFLVLSDLRAAAQPGVVYEISLYHGTPSPGPAAAAGDPDFVGTLNFFAAAPPGNQDLSRRYDVTDKIDTLLAEGSGADPIAVIIVPIGTPDAAALPSIGKIALVTQ